jgi:ribosomal protein S18 acetylase RimI-like enzyme
MDEAEHKLRSTTKKVLGEDADEYIYLEYLCCAPERQGRGYGSALVRTVTRMVCQNQLFNSLYQRLTIYELGKGDDQRRKVWLTCVLKNVEFYRAHGFETVAELQLGDDPAYRGAPVLAYMVRIDARLRSNNFSRSRVLSQMVYEPKAQ